MHPRDPDMGSWLRGASVVVEPEICDPPGDEADEVDPDPVGVAFAIDRVELGAHDPGEHENLAELAASRPARGRASRARERLRSHLLREEALVLRVELDQNPADRREVSVVERLLQLLEAGCLRAAHRALTQDGNESRASGGRARRRVPLMRRSIASGGSSATCPLSMSLPGHLPALVARVK